MKKNEKNPVLVNDRRCTNLMKAVSCHFYAPYYALKGAILLFALLAFQAHGQGINLAFLTNGLVAHYPFNGNANDMSGNGDNGTVYNAVLSTDRHGRTNSAYYFNLSQTSAIQTQGKAIPTGRAAKSFTCWFKPQTPVVSSGVMWSCGKLQSGTYLEARLFDISSQTDVALAVGVYDASYHRYVSALDGRWHHFAVVITDTSTVAAYLDGESIVFQKSAPPGTIIDLAAGPFYIGYGGGEYFTGWLDDVRVYNRVLPTNEIQALFQYESQPPRRLSIAKAVRLDITVEVGKPYQLETTDDLVTWTPSGTPFTATTMAFSQYVDVADYNQFFRLVDAP
jgi:hypothetical protein